MRSDESLEKSVVDAKEWDSDPVTGKSAGDVDRYKLPHSLKARMSLSGSERNRMFVKSPVGQFVDVSGNSGLDSPSDGRTISV